MTGIGRQVDPGTPELSVVIVSWNTREMLRACLASVGLRLASLDHEVIVVDNASQDGSAEMVAADFPGARLIRNRANLGFGRANNQAMRAARGRWLLLLNSDAALIDGSVAELFRALDRDRRPDAELASLGVAQCRLQFPDGRLQRSAYRFPTLGRALFESLGLYKLASDAFTADQLLDGYWDHGDERDVDWVAGSFMLLPREVFEATGGFDERIFMYGEDLEWCYRIHDHGWRVRFFPRAAIVHHAHQSADLKWGDKRIQLCLQTERDVYAARHGRLAARALVLARLAGQALRVVYFSVRARLPDGRAPSYEPMRRHAGLSARALVALALGRR